jgi:uncharacterized Zn finger protein
MNNDRIVKWKCPECGNYHKWVWDIYDIIGGEITMTCDNPECGRTSKMCMVVEKNGNATALVADNSQVEEKLRRATEKVMNSQTEIDISTGSHRGRYRNHYGGEVSTHHRTKIKVLLKNSI